MRWLRRWFGGSPGGKRAQRSRHTLPMAGVAPEVFESRVLLSAAFSLEASISQLGAPVSYAAGSAAVVVAASAVVSDTNNAFANSKLTVSVAHGNEGRATAATTDQLSIAASGGVALDGSGNVLYNGTAIGTVTGGSNGTPLVVSFDANATQAGVQAVLDDVAYANSSSTPANGSRFVVFQFTDGSNNAAWPVGKPVFVTPAASINLVSSPAIFTAGGAPVAIAGGATVSDVGGAFANSKLSVAISSWGERGQSSSSTDELSILASGGVTLDNSGDVLYNGTTIATLSGGAGTAPLVVSFNAAATQAGVNAVLDNIAYANSDAAITTGFRVAVLQYTDGNGSASLPADAVVQVVPAASVTQLGAPVSYAAGGSPVVVAPTGVVSDSTGAYAHSTLNVAIATRGIDRGQAIAGDELSILAGGGITLGANGAVLYNGSTIATTTGGTAGAALAVSFNATATQAEVQAVLDAVAFSNANAAPPTGARVVVFQFTDGNGSASAPASKLVQVTLGASITQLGGPVVYTAGASPVVLAASGAVNDVNNAFASSHLTVSISNWIESRSGASSSGDQLSIVPTSLVTLGSGGSVLYAGTAIGTVTGGTGGTPLAVAFNASATQAGVQAVLDAVAFSNTSANPHQGPREVVFQFTDGAGTASLAAGKIVQVTSAAAISNLGTPVAYVPGGAPVVVAPNAVVADAANAFANSQLTISTLSFGFGRGNNTANDQLSVVATGGVTLGVNGSIVFNGTTVGTATGGTAGAPLTIAFNASATQASVQAVLDSVAYASSSNGRAAGSRFVVFQFTDGNGTESMPVGKPIETQYGFAPRNTAAIDAVFGSPNFNW